MEKLKTDFPNKSFSYEHIYIAFTGWQINHLYQNKPQKRNTLGNSDDKILTKRKFCENYTTLKCNLCYREVGCWNFYDDSPALKKSTSGSVMDALAPKFDGISQHFSFCPWVYSEDKNSGLEQLSSHFFPRYTTTSDPAFALNLRVIPFLSNHF